MFPYYTAKNLFFAELVHKAIVIPNQFYIPLFIINGLLIWLIGRKLLKGGYHFIPPLVYFLSPWIYYLTFAQSFYIFLLFLTLLIAYGLIQTETGGKKLGNIFVLTGSVIAIYCSLSLLIILPILFILLSTLKIVSLKNIKTSAILLILLTLPLLTLIDKNTVGFKNILRNEIKIFSDPGLVNTVNRYQGAATQEGYKNLARISENRYLFFAEYSALKYFTQLVPETFFTPQYKLLGFSFSPPVLLGFIIPFAYGLYKLFQKSNSRRILFISTLLVVPSVLANNLVSLNRLVLFSPIIIFVISFGLIYLYGLKKNKTAKVFLALTIILVIFQLAVTFSDIKTREIRRFEKYFGEKFELVEQ